MPTSCPPPPTLRWDVFCRVVDNFGDIGVCWRLAAELAARGQRVRLWCDDASALAWMAPAGAPGVAVHSWPEAVPTGGVGDVVIEGFGCDIPSAFAEAMAQQPRAPLWINLEYLSAEPYVERCHRLPSPLMSGPGAGLTRWFFYPGFTPHTGGLLREHDLQERQHAFDRPAWRAHHGVASETLAVSLFCYEPPALAELLQQLHGLGNAQLLVTPGRATAAVRALQDVHQNQPQRPPTGRDPLSITYLSPCPHAEFDALLWACDLNCVRGEDSLVRALWAGQPLLWQLYPQNDDAHHAKLQAFLDWLQAPASLRRWHAHWNGLAPADPLPPLDAARLAEWRDCVQTARARLLQQSDLVTQLFGLIAEKG